MATPPQPFWSAADGRYLIHQYHEASRRYYFDHFDQEKQQWTFYKWERPDSVMAYEGQAGGPAGWREGPTVEGTYNFANPAPDTHFEPLDKSYFVRDKGFFNPGKVFSVLFTEGAGSTAMQNYKRDAITVVKFGEMAHTQIRRFIVVQQKREFCYALPIFSYSNQGTKKAGVVPSEHAIAYSYGFQATLLPGEEKLEKDPICIVPIDTGPLSTASRIYFGIHHPIQYNVKVKDLGYVLPNDLANLLKYWAMEHSTGTNQGADAGD